MPAFFQEVIAAVGVDEDAKPRPGMIVPVGGSNVVRLSGGTGLRLDAPGTLKIDEVPSSGVAALTALSLPFAALSLLFTSVAPKPSTPSDTRYFVISGRVPIGPVPAQVKAFGASRLKPEAVLDVAVLRRER
jgi:hypothetical protein